MFVFKLSRDLIKSSFLMVSSLISMNSGFGNIYLAASRLGKYIATILLHFKELNC